MATCITRHKVSTIGISVKRKKMIREEKTLINIAVFQVRSGIYFMAYNSKTSLPVQI